VISSLVKAIIVVLLVSAAPTAAALVKMSNSGVCHPPQSSWYDRTKSYQPFESVDACLASGGRLPKNIAHLAQSASANQKVAPMRNYSRSAFGHGWDDSDGDCQDSRAEALISASSTPVRFAAGDRCRVVTGRWISPFTGKVIQNAAEVDIDHVVPLNWAWDHGASSWPRPKREKFANDPVNLIPVEASLNRSKGARGPKNWLPPSGKCAYVARFYRVIKTYQLQLSAAEAKWIRDFLQQCR
jgi:hypothetical protein